MDTPKEKNIDTREALLKFHKRYYSANIMTLCVLGKGRKRVQVFHWTLYS